MKLFAATLAMLSLAASAQAEQRKPAPRVAPADVRAVAPALADYTDEILFADLWARPDLAPRDRSIVTVAALVAGGHTRQMTGHFNRALTNGMTPREITGIITHLAFYSGWPNAMSAVGVAKEVFDKRGIGPDQLTPPSDEPLPIDEAAEARRAAAVEAMAGAVAPALAGYTNGVLFGDLWRRDDLTPRDRSLATIAALIAAGQAEQLTFHLNRGMDNGLTRAQLSEVITHLAFYAGWPRAMSAIPVAKSVFEARGLPPGEGPETQGSTTLDIVRHDSTPAQPGPAEYFTGTVRIASRFQRTDPARVGGAIVSFEPGARTAWHTHPLGQTLIVTAGQGWIQREGGPVEEIRPGDVVWIPPGEKHWHGATATTAMTHVAVSESLNGKSVDWLEHVTDAQYGAR
ncbi:(R)-mandelonitrile lyase [Inquilinus sp. CA228]|uniref:(R)-mandelonitrile lyase n=1 Tax=Inquilinus sp. CA228 TaxID=3455609 RepID=UPI003F8D2656